MLKELKERNKRLALAKINARPAQIQSVSNQSEQPLDWREFHLFLLCRFLLHLRSPIEITHTSQSRCEAIGLEEKRCRKTYAFGTGIRHMT